MNCVEYKVRKVPGNTGSDSWAATVYLNDAGVDVRIGASGETAESASQALGRLLKHVQTELNRACERV